jgi:hypothetical protein
VPLLLAGLQLSQARLVRSGNFFGYDEWTVLGLVSRGIVDTPYAQRPLSLLWALPAAALPGPSFAPFVALREVYLFLTGLLVYRIARSLDPSRPLLAFLAGGIAVLWTPADLARLAVVEGVLYCGIALGATLSIAALLEGCLRRRRSLLVLAGLLALVSGLSYEATLPLLAAAPLLLLCAPRQGERAPAGWLLAFEGTVGLGIALALLPLALGGGESYQAALGPDARPTAVAARLLLQLRLHFGPLWPGWAGGVWGSGAAIAAVAFAVLGAVAARAARPRATGTPPWRLAGVGLFLACAGYGVLLLSASQAGAWRTQALSRPGAALCLAALAVAVGELVPRGRTLVSLGLGTWIAAVGTARLAEMQRSWDATSLYRPQMAMLSALVEAVPDVREDSLIVVLDERRSWRASFSFHHAAELLYQGRAGGLVWGLPTLMFPAYFGAPGIRVDPIESVQRSWGARPRLFPYEAIVVVRYGVAGLRVEEAWPSELPPLPPSARYQPASRIRDLVGGIPGRRALYSLGP